jgi:hypothetical protein
MRLIIIGCEYAGKTTLTEGIREWLISNMGSCQTSFHDHFLPWRPGHTGDKAEKVDSELKLLTVDDTSLVEQFCRYILHYHTHPDFYAKADHCAVNWHYGDAVYAPLYYGFGGSGEYADRQAMARTYDAMVMELAPDTVLVHLKATPEVIRKRREADANPNPYPHDEHVELVLRRFDEEYERSLIRKKIALDTSETTSEETLKEFLRLIKPMLTSDDRLRMLTHRDG